MQMTFKILKFLIIQLLILIFSFKSHSTCNDTIHKNSKFTVHYKFGVSFLYYYRSPFINQMDYGNVKSFTNNSYGISLSHDLYLLPKFYINAAFEYAWNYSRIEYNDYLANRYIKVDKSSFLLSIPIRVNYAIISFNKIKLTVGVGANFLNIQEVRNKGNIYYNNENSKVDERKQLNIRNFFDRNYWTIYETNCIGVEYCLKKHLTFRLLLNFDVSSNKKYLIGTKLGFLF